MAEQPVEIRVGLCVVSRGELYITRQYASQVMSGLRNRARREELVRQVKLSVREQQIIGHLMHARTNREIAGALVLSDHTVRRHLQNIFNKIGVSSRAAATAFAFQRDLV